MIGELQRRWRGGGPDGGSGRGHERRGNGPGGDPGAHRGSNPAVCSLVIIEREGEGRLKVPGANAGCFTNAEEVGKGDEGQGARDGVEG